MGESTRWHAEMAGRQTHVPAWPEGTSPLTRQAARPFEQSEGHAVDGYSAGATPIGQLTPVPPKPQYPFGFLLSERYCWW